MFPRELKVPPQKTPIRLDKFLVEKFPGTSRAFWRKNLEKALRIDGRSAKKAILLQGGEKLEFLKGLSLEETPEPDPSVAGRVLLEDPSFLVVEKPPGIPVHPLEPGERKTLIQGVLARYPEIASVGKQKREMGLVHRLDHETSGLVLIARTSDAYHFLREEFQRHRVKKEYLALVYGKVGKKKEGEWEKIDLPIAHHPKNKRKMVILDQPLQPSFSKGGHSHHSPPFEKGGRGGISSKGGRQAITYYQVEKQFADVTLLRIRIPTGVRHQIRVHLAHRGYPIVGDSLYGAVGAIDESPLQGRFFLHATLLSFRHPKTLKPVECVSKLPEDLKRFLEGCILSL